MRKCLHLGLPARLPPCLPRCLFIYLSAGSVVCLFVVFLYVCMCFLFDCLLVFVLWLCRCFSCLLDNVCLQFFFACLFPYYVSVCLPAFLPPTQVLACLSLPFCLRFCLPNTYARTLDPSVYLPISLPPSLYPLTHNSTYLPNSLPSSLTYLLTFPSLLPNSLPH